MLGPGDISCYFDYVATGLHLKEYTFRELAELMKSTGFRSVRYRIEAAGRVWWAAPASIMIVVESIYSLLTKGARGSSQAQRGRQHLTGHERYRAQVAARG